MTLAGEERASPVLDGAPRRPLQSLQVMRGVAAVAVAIYHVHLILAQPVYGGYDLFGAVAGKGWLGVNFFFVLSGFIIPYAHHRDAGQPARIPRYLWRRFSRVYPIYWLALTAYVAAAAVGIGHPDFRWSAPDLLTDYLLVRFVAEPSLPLAVAWTLFYELFFYATFTIAIVDRRAGLAALAAWGAGILAGSLWFGIVTGPLSMWNLYFLGGVAAYVLAARLPERWGMPLLLGGAVALLAVLAADLVPDRIALAQASPPCLALLAVPFALIVLGAILWERARGWSAPGLVLLLGNASYSIYLVHSPAISLIAQLAHKLAPGLIPPAALFAIAAVLSVATGVFTYLLVERPLLAWLHRRGDATREARGAHGG